MKKINSEINYKNDFFNIKVGTTDKKNPNVVYLDCSAYLEPKCSMSEYTKEIEDLEKEMKEKINKMFSMRTFKEKNDFIFVFDIPKDRFEYGKRSFLSVQIHWKRWYPNLSGKFQDYVWWLTTGNLHDSILEMFKEMIEKHNFKVYKTKH